MALRASMLFVSSALALLCAHALGIEHPYWAAIPVWVVAQSYREDLLIRGAHRFIGTLLGAGASLSIVSTIPSQFAEASVAVALIVTGALAAYRIGTIHSYGAKTFAITVLVVLLPTINDYSSDVALAYDRITATVLGVASVTLITYITTSRRTGPRPPHIDAPMSATWMRGMVAAPSIGLAAVLNILIGGPVVLGAGMTFAVYTVVLCAEPDSARIEKNLLPGALVGVGMAFAYQFFAHLFRLTDIMHVLSILPFLAFGAFLRVYPRTAGIGLNANIVFLLTSAVGITTPPASVYVATGLAVLVGCFAAILAQRITRLTRPTDRLV